MRTSSVRARPLAVPPPPEIFLQVAQWHALTSRNGTSTAIRTPPHWQVPVSSAISV